MTVQLVACGGGGSGEETTANASAAATGSVTIAWTAPVARADGSPLSLAEIGGYRIYYGSSADEYPYRVDVSEGAAEDATISDLPAGTYYFVVTTFDSTGRESTFSRLVWKDT
jgi:hypothetical protein